MGTFLKIVGIIALVFGIIIIVFTLFGMSRFLSFLTASNLPNESSTMMPGTSWKIAENIHGAIGGLVIIIGGVALYCLGAIYNNVMDMKTRS
ncbi:MAG: hypothetical protein GX428_01510 [Candidatus Atribacteria bacterium]|nr:hypothetical protein [Candidatus Atribacteria bacterium]